MSASGEGRTYRAGSLESSAAQSAGEMIARTTSGLCKKHMHPSGAGYEPVAESDSINTSPALLEDALALVDLIARFGRDFVDPIPRACGNSVHGGHEVNRHAQCAAEVGEL